jgi:hypothetical protein
MVNKSNIVLILIGTFFSVQFVFIRAIGFIGPFHHWHTDHHWISNSLGFTSLLGVFLILLGLYNIYKDNKASNSNNSVQSLNSNERK